MIKSEFYRGDTWELNYLISDGDDNSLDLNSWEIRAEIKDNNKSIKKANNKVTGGSENQIIVLDAIGNIKITINKEESRQLEPGHVILEVEITSPLGKRFTVIRDSIKVLEDIINWEEK